MTFPIILKNSIGWFTKLPIRLVVLVAQSCANFCDPMDCSLSGLSVHGIQVGCHSLLHGIFPTQGSNQGLPYCKQIFTIWATRLIDGIARLHFRRGISSTSDSFSCFCFSKRPKFSSTLLYPGTEMSRMQIELQWLPSLNIALSILSFS